MFAEIIKPFVGHWQRQRFSSTPGSLAVKGKTSVRAGSYKGLGPAALGQPFHAPDGFFCFGLSGNAHLGIHGPDLGFSIKRTAGKGK